MNSDTSKILFVVDAESWKSSNSEVGKLLNIISRIENKIDPSKEVHILLFVDQGREELLNVLQSNLSCRLNFINVVEVIDRVSPEFRTEMTHFGAKLGKNLYQTAIKIAGESTAREFANAWWWLQLSSRNLPGDAVWTYVLRFMCFKRVVDEFDIQDVFFVGEDVSAKLAKEFCGLNGISCLVEVFEGDKKTKSNFILRMYDCLALLAANVLSRYFLTKEKNTSESPKTLAFSYFPRSWFESKTWSDRYYGNFLNQKHEAGEHIYYGFGMLDAIRPGQFQDAVERNKLLKTRPPQWPFSVLESFSNVFEIVFEHINIKPILLYQRLRRQKEFQNAFSWKGLSLRSLLEPSLSKSIWIDWPRFSILEKCAYRLAVAVQPVKEALVLFFEFPVGRALMRGLRKAGVGKVTALQHGPITPLKLIYTIDPEEYQKNHMPDSSPLADEYIVETPQAKDILVEGGIEKDNIQIQFAERLKVLSEVEPSQMSYEKQPISILVGLGLHDMDMLMTVVASAVDRSNQYQWMIKAHPKTPKTQLEKWKAKIKSDQVVWADVKSDIHKLMQKSHFFVGSYSSVLLEAIWIGLPSFVLRSQRQPDYSPYAISSMRPFMASEAAVLLQHIESLLLQPEKRLIYVDEMRKTLNWALGPIGIPA